MVGLTKEQRQYVENNKIEQLDCTELTIMVYQLHDRLVEQEKQLDKLRKGE